MYLSSRQLTVIFAPLIVLAAIIGFLAGHRGTQLGAQGSSGSAEQPLLLHQANVELEYPSTWQPSNIAPAIPGLAITHPLLLAPSGNSARAGLLSGTLPPGEPAPLPARLVGLMPEAPHTEVVNFLNVQAYRYNPLHVPGFAPSLELYVIPNTSGSPTALACYAGAGASSYMHECEQIVASLTPVGHSASDLKPSTDYSGKLGQSVGALDRERTLLRRELGLRKSPATVASLANTLADRFAAAATSIQTLHPPAAALAAQEALVASLERARDAYRTVAAAAESGGPASVAATQPQVDGAETGVNGALEAFALLGYKHA
jgi:hypothetical protein